MAGMLSEHIAALRKERGLTQEQLGKMVGVSAQAVGKWEKGGAPDVELLPVLSRQLGVTIDALFGLEGGEQVDVEDAVRRWMCTVPRERRVPPGVVSGRRGHQQQAGGPGAHQRL